MYLTVCYYHVGLAKLLSVRLRTEWLWVRVPLLSLNNTHMEELDSVQEFNEIRGWLLLTFFICLHDQLSSFNSIIVQMSEKHDSSSRQ